MARVTKIFIAILLVVSLCGCDIITTTVDIIKNVADITTNPSSEELDIKAENLYTETTEVISYKDSSSLYQLFSTKNKASITKDEIDSFFKKINGDITAFGEHNMHHSRIHFIYDSIDYAIREFTVKDVLTSKESIYSLNIIMCVNSKDNEDYVGVQYIGIYENENLVAEIGECIESYTPQEFPNKYSEIDRTTSFSSDIEESYTLNMIYYLNQKDKNSFVSLFSEEAKASAESSFDEIIKLINGQLKTYSIIDRGAGGGGIYKYDHYENLHNAVTIYDILADNGNMYEIYIYADFINLSEPNEEGIHSFSIRLVENKINRDLEHTVIEEIKIEQ